MTEQLTESEKARRVGARAGAALQREMVERERAGWKRRGERGFREAMDRANTLRRVPLVTDKASTERLDLPEGSD